MGFAVRRSKAFVISIIPGRNTRMAPLTELLSVLAGGAGGAGVAGDSGWYLGTNPGGPRREAGGEEEGARESGEGEAAPAASRLCTMSTTSCSRSS